MSANEKQPLGLEEHVRSISDRLTRAHIKLDRVTAALTGLEQRLSLPSSPEVDKAGQILLSLKYRELAKQGVILPLAETEFRNYSQTGEDGILHYLFSVIGTTDRRCVEMCAGNGRESNTANLVINHGWHALLLDGDQDNVTKGRLFYNRHPATGIIGPLFAREWIDRDSVNPVLEKYGFTGDLDLLSLDIDGVDYWVWEAMTAVRPRVVVVEYTSGLDVPPVSVPYDPRFKARWVELPRPDHMKTADCNTAVSGKGFYGGASLSAFVSLARSKGYRLVGTNMAGHNAFFMRDDVGADYFGDSSNDPGVPSLFDHRDLLELDSQAYPWVEV